MFERGSQPGPARRPTSTVAGGAARCAFTALPSGVGRVSALVRPRASIAMSTAGRPTIGVLITYHDERELLRECLESIARQTVPPDEVLVFDDASKAPAAAYVPAGLPVRVLRTEANRGPSHG